MNYIQLAIKEGGNESYYSLSLQKSVKNSAKVIYKQLFKFY